MKAFKFTFDGLALGGEAVVIAKDTESAVAALHAKAAEKGFVIKDLDVKDIEDFSTRQPTVVHFWNGDY